MGKIIVEELPSDEEDNFLPSGSDIDSENDDAPVQLTSSAKSLLKKGIPSASSKSITKKKNKKRGAADIFAQELPQAEVAKLRQSQAQLEQKEAQRREVERR